MEPTSLEPIRMDLPFNLKEWIEANRHELVPPVNNKQIWPNAELLVTVIGGGNERTDYHDDPLPEFFYQLEGTMNLRIMDAPGSPPRDMPIVAGDVYFLPPHVRHSPQRKDPDGIGLVIEMARPEGSLDGFEWYCPNCNELVYRAEVQLKEIDKDLPPIFEAFYNNEAAHICANCGHVHPGKG